MKFSGKDIGFFTLVFFFLCLPVLYSCGALKSENQKLKEKIFDITAANEKLKKELNTLKSENSDMHARLAQLDQQISELQKEIEILQKDLDSMKVRVRGFERKKKS